MTCYGFPMVSKTLEVVYISNKRGPVRWIAECMLEEPSISGTVYCVIQMPVTVIFEIQRLAWAVTTCGEKSIRIWWQCPLRIRVCGSYVSLLTSVASLFHDFFFFFCFTGRMLFSALAIPSTKSYFGSPKQHGFKAVGTTDFTEYLRQWRGFTF